MAIFNPEVAKADDKMPNYFKYSDSISQPKADESGGIALKTIGQGIEGVAELADSTVKGVIKSDVYDRVDKERQDFTNVLTATKNYGAGAAAVPGSNPGAPADGAEGPTNAPVDLMANTQANVPNAINQGIARAGVIQAGLDGNKISQTTYYQRLGDIAKDLRSTYPGYRDYIDQQISHITGVTPANAYIDSIIQDISRQGTTAAKEHDYWRNKIVESGFPDNDKVLAEFEKTGNYQKVAQYLADNNGIRSSLALKKAAFEANQNDQTGTLKTATDYANSVALTAATTHFYNSQKYTNGDMSPADIADKMADLSLHPEKANDEAYQGLAERYAALHVQAYNQTMRALTVRPQKPDGTYGKSVADAIGPDATKGIVDKTIGGLFDKTRELIADKQFSPAYHLQNAATAIVNNKQFSVLNSPTIGATVQTYTVINKLMPNFIPLLQGKALGNNLDKDLSDLVTQQSAQAVAQTGGKYYGTDGQIYSFKQSMDELKQAGNISGNPVPGQAYKNLIEIRQTLSEPTASPQAIKNVVNYLYDPKVNKGTMSQLMDDYYDPAKGGMVKGRSSAFADLTDQKVTQSIWTRGDKSDWNKYSAWSKGEFADQFGSNVRDLNETAAQGNFRVGWNAEKKELTLTNKDGSPLHGLQETMVNLPYRAVTNLNSGLRNIANIAKTEGTNVDAYLFKVLRDNGFTPTKEIDGVPAQIMRSLITANGGKIKDVQAPVSRFAPEPDYSLGSFLNAPAGSVEPPRPTLEPYQTRGIISGNLSDQPIGAPIRTNQ